MRKLIVALILAITLIACGGDTYSSIDEAIAGENCEVDVHQTEGWLSTDEVHCKDGTMISWHGNEAERKMYADFIGVEPSEQGRLYNIYRN